MAYATVQDVEDRWRPLSDADKVRAGVLLEDAAVEIDSACPPTDPIADAEARLIVSCRMVKRAMATPGGADGVGVESVQAGAGPFQQTQRFVNPSGDLYLTKADRRLLGCGDQVAFTVPMGNWAPVAPDWWVTP